MATPGRLAALPLVSGCAARRSASNCCGAAAARTRASPGAAAGHRQRAAGGGLRLRGPLLPLFASSEVESLLDDPQQPVLSTPVFGLADPTPVAPCLPGMAATTRPAEGPCPRRVPRPVHTASLSLLYRVLRASRGARFRVPAATPVAQLRALSGLLPKALHERLALPDSAVLARTALFAGGRRSLAGFAGLVRQHFGVEARLDAYQGAWKEIPTASRARLQRGGRNAPGSRCHSRHARTWDEHAGIAPQPRSAGCPRGRPLLPDGDAHGQLASLAALYFGPRPGLSPEPAGERRRAAAPGARYTAQAELEHQPTAHRRRPAALHRSRPAAHRR
ncbi:type VI secretion system baseplate subunit TssG [Pseudomonas aeruginosa]